MKVASLFDDDAFGSNRSEAIIATMSYSRYLTIATTT